MSQRRPHLAPVRTLRPVGEGGASARRPSPLLRQVYGGLLRKARHDQSRTLSDVAREAGVSMPYLSEVERGLKEPSSEVLEALCGALGAGVADLVGAAHRELTAVVEPTPLRSTAAAPASGGHQATLLAA